MFVHVPDPCHVSNTTLVHELLTTRVDNALASCSSEGAILTTALLVSMVMIDVDTTGILTTSMTSFTAVGSGWSAIRATRPPDRSLHTTDVDSI